MVINKLNNLMNLDSIRFYRINIMSLRDHYMLRNFNHKLNSLNY